MLDNVQINQKPIAIRRALISVYDKTNIDQLAKSLIENNCEVISTGGTSEALKNVIYLLQTLMILRVFQK